MSTLSTHILDTACGRPAGGITVTLCQRDGDHWDNLGRAHTNTDGRAPELVNADQALTPGTYRIHFALAAYFEAQQLPVFYPFAEVVFRIEGPSQHYHIPLLLSPYGYSTYRGS